LVTEAPGWARRSNKSVKKHMQNNQPWSNLGGLIKG